MRSPDMTCAANPDLNINHIGGFSMVSTAFYAQPNQFLARINPFYGINWFELRQAYRVFLSDPSQGILHILVAGRSSNWQRWVEVRLAHQAADLAQTALSINVAELLQLPENTLGGAYARHITSQGFDPEAFIAREDQAHWLNQRLGLSHDVHHVITGFDGSPLGEFGLAAFVLVQYRDLLNVFVLSHLPWFMLGNPSLVPKAISSLIKGLRHGFVCRPIIAYPFEANWHKPLLQVRQELGLQ
jgi:Coenzyme Q (ubiquinone) biosynthesis protein Coq4